MTIYEQRRASLLGARFGLLTITGYEGRSALCLCDCGKQHKADLANIKAGKTGSCGCRKKELTLAGVPHYIHGHGRGSKSTRIHNIWVQMRQRCENPTSEAFARYGGRGIKVCEHWQEFANFLADMGERPEGKTLDRYPDNDGDYEPGNCRWASSSEQARNRRSCVNLTIWGETKTIKGWTEDSRCRVNYATLRARIARRWKPEDAVALSLPAPSTYISYAKRAGVTC